MTSPEFDPAHARRVHEFDQVYTMASHDLDTLIEALHGAIPRFGRTASLSSLAARLLDDDSSIEALVSLLTVAIDRLEQQQGSRW